MKRSLLIIFAVALTVRVLFSLIAFSVLADRTGLNAKSDGYEKIAANIVAGNGFCFHPDYAQTTLRVPVYSYFLSGVFSVFGERLWVVQVIQSAISALTAVLITWIGWKSFGRMAGMLAGLAFCFYPGDLVSCARYVAEPMAVLALILTVIAAARFQKNQTIAMAILVGVLFGSLGQIKSSLAYLPPLLIVVLLWSTGIWKNLRRTAVMGACFILPMVVISAPWVFRGYNLTGHFFYPSTLGGQGLMDGYYVSAYMDSGKSVRELLYDGRARFRELAEQNDIFIDPKDKYSWTFRTAADEYKMDLLLKSQFRETVRNDPVDFVKRSIIGLGRYWYLASSSIQMFISAAIHFPLVFMGAVGAFLAVRAGHRQTWLWIAVIFYLNVLNGIVDPLVRYAVPAIPFLLMLSASWIAGFFRTYSQGQERLEGNLAGA